MSDSKKYIKILPDYIANMIAAGEVVQRPESVVKELVENSLDSRADQIAVIVRGAGKELIHVVDNGDGMNKEDLELSIKRHATSKITSAEDLEKILTFGFRGEALASIAAVSQMEIRTRRKDDKLGWKLISEPLKKPDLQPIACDTGTQVFVRNLFYNIPARRKFLKSNLTEFRHISETMMKVAISNPEKRFTFYDGENLIFDVSPSDERTRIEKIFGNATAKSLLRVVYENELMRLEGYIGQPHQARQTRSGQYLFLGGRSIASRSISHAVFSAFEHLLEKQQQPIYILNIQMNPERVDINVHPQKHEVKFDNERYVYNTIRKAVSQTLRDNNLTPEINPDAAESRQPFLHPRNKSKDDDLMVVNKVTGEVVEPREELTNSGGRSFSPRRNFSFDRFEKKVESKGRDIESEISAFDELFNKQKNDRDAEQTATMQEENISPNETTISGEMYWQLHNKYILMQTGEGMMIIDQHAAHERILYEKAVKMMDRDFSQAQKLLFPIEIDIGSDKLSTLKEMSDELNSIGYIFETDNESIKLSGVPGDIRNGEEERSLIEILELFEEYEEKRSTDRRDNLAASYSCKAAIKTGEKLSQEEIKGLVGDLKKCEMPYVCPHGRPIFMEYTIKQLDKQFKRIL